ncbi:hypothetical protein [Cesiribacter andamanensis]|uniref:Lipoprotein n=1 Tax=Cesiribacter andamanensis AMV16 TaxID=1279009 RepID=M7N0Q5_9BACT|nr:hypothetical protein [Cesiribacter andamanensis]EMR02253.1 hypothetical protein ADICEAN_02601 [Cesiribacter andamanensis AMV16]
MKKSIILLLLLIGGGLTACTESTKEGARNTNSSDTISIDTQSDPGTGAPDTANQYMNRDTTGQTTPRTGGTGSGSGSNQ